MAHLQKFAELLKALLSPTNTERQQAETMYQQAKTGDPEQLIVGLMSVLAADGIDESIAGQAAILIRQLVTQGSEKDFAFARLRHEVKAQVAQELLRRFEIEGRPKLQKKVAETVARLAEVCCDKDDQRGWLGSGTCGWPALLPQCFRMADPASNTNPVTCEAAIRLLKDLVPTLKDEIVRAQQQLGPVLQNSFQHSEARVKIAAALLVCEIVGSVEKKAWAALTPTAPVLTQVLMSTSQPHLSEELQELLQAFVETAEVEPDFFKQQLQSTLEPAKVMSQLVKTKGLDDGVRNLALEFLVSYTEKKPKWLAKSLPALPALAIECCMDMMLEIEDGDAELKEWAERMDDEEGEEDSDELFHAGEQAIDRVVEAMGMESVSQALFAKVGEFTAKAQWQAKHAALAAMKQTVEYMEETDHVNEVAKLLLAHVDHAHPRVRYISLHAIGQLANDQAPHFQDTWHTTVMPQLLRKMDDQVDRVAAMAMSAFVSFGEELDKTLMLSYANGFMEKLVTKLRSSQHRMVQEECITSIAVIAGVIENDFSQYYDGMMPMLKNFVMNATDVKQSRLRGKAFECMSLLGIAVGKEKFLPDAREAIGHMMNLSAEADDLQREYIKEASERICKCLKNDFAPFLPAMLPKIFKALQLEGESVVAGKEDDDDDEFVTVTTGQGQLMKVRTAKFEEATQSVQLITTFGSEMEGSYYDYIHPTAQALLPLLSHDNDLAVLCDEARSAAYQAWALMVKCARIGAQERNLPATICNEMVKTFLEKVMVIVDHEKDPDSIREAMVGIAQTLKNGGQGMIASDVALNLVRRLFGLIDESMHRTVKIAQSKKEAAEGLTPDLADDDEEDTSADDEEHCRRACEDAMGAVMEVAPIEFIQCLPDVSQKLQQWLNTKEHRCLGLFLACDMLQHLKEKSEPVWPIFMPVVFTALKDSDPDVRIPAAYAVNLAALIPTFAQAAPEAYRSLGQILSAPTPKKRDEKGKVALDNATAALLSLATHRPDACPAEVPAWQLIVARLPIKDDEEEARKVHKAIVDLLVAQNAGLLGPDGAHLGKIMSALAEVYKQEDLCEKETDEKIKHVFKMIPGDRLRALGSSFTEKQAKKIEAMLSS